MPHKPFPSDFRVSTVAITRKFGKYLISANNNKG